jgi:Ca-activated chloride channel homolog
MTGRVLVLALLAGWLADRLARPDRDVEAGIEAYEAGEHDVALARFDAAIARHGDRPELSLDRGLALLAQGQADAARRAFERASESDDPEVRASAFYERGNVAFDAEQWDAAIEAYVECLEARPDHRNAKWNLELARQRKQEQEKEQEQQDPQDDQDQSDETGGDETGGDETGGDETGGDESGGGESGQPPDQGGTGDREDPQDPQDPQQDPQDPQDPQQNQQDQPPPGPEPQPLDRMDIQKALEELDAQDRFLLDRPLGGLRPPAEDW